MKPEYTFIIYPTMWGSVHISGGDALKQAKFNLETHECLYTCRDMEVDAFMQPRVPDMLRELGSRKPGNPIAIEYYSNGEKRVLDKLREVPGVEISHLYHGKRLLGHIC